MGSGYHHGAPRPRERIFLAQSLHLPNSHYGEQHGDSFKTLGIKPPYNSAIPLLSIYPEETRIEKDTRTPMFTAALFTIATTRKQPRCPSTGEWIKKLWYIYAMEYFSVI